MKTSIKKRLEYLRLEYLRRELRAERISLEELSELQGLVPHIGDDVELLEAAGVPESKYNAMCNLRRFDRLYVVPTRRTGRRSPFVSTAWKVLAINDGKITDVSADVAEVTDLKWLDEGAVQCGYDYTVRQRLEVIGLKMKVERF